MLLRSQPDSSYPVGGYSSGTGFPSEKVGIGNIRNEEARILVEGWLGWCWWRKWRWLLEAMVVGDVGGGGGGDG